METESVPVDWLGWFEDPEAVPGEAAPEFLRAGDFGWSVVRAGLSTRLGWNSPLYNTAWSDLLYEALASPCEYDLAPFEGRFPEAVEADEPLTDVNDDPSDLEDFPPILAHNSSLRRRSRYFNPPSILHCVHDRHISLVVILRCFRFHRQSFIAGDQCF